MSDSQDELLTRPAAKKRAAVEAVPEHNSQIGLDRDEPNLSAMDIPMLESVVQHSKQKDLADLLIKIIQTNEAEDSSSPQSFDADISSATLRDIDAKLNAALEEDTVYSPAPMAEAEANSIPLLTEIAEFPVSEAAVLEFPTANATDSNAPIFEFPATARVGSETSAANSGNAPQSANQDNVQQSAQATSDAPARWSFSDDFTSEHAATIASSDENTIEQLVEQHAERVREQLDLQIEKMKQKLLADLLNSPEKES